MPEYPNQQLMESIAGDFNHEMSLLYEDLLSETLRCPKDDVHDDLVELRQYLTDSGLLADPKFERELRHLIAYIIFRVTFRLTACLDGSGTFASTRDLSIALNGVAIPTWIHEYLDSGLTERAKAPRAPE